ncbi:YkyA family protein [Sporosarcina aquimarina]|uniref:YkyA family protein n=1 Tax=Sporosarcina aquimarina TaxID=114975 RepID=A0ABU4G2U9_9BACL|nr:YkyA family protein [Sporosarcina aquimarina]MDW0110687.1 YkyA family protein [Sporosarcina aquimarina]
MKKVMFLAILAGLLSVLAGCQSDQEQATEIHTKVEESASLEDKFTANQKDLASSRKKVNESYQKVLSLENNDAETIKQTLNDLEISTESKKLDEARENFQNAYATLMSIDENIKLIKDKDEKKTATKIMTLMKDRKKLMDSYFELYQKQLDSQSKLFENLEQGNFELAALEEQVKTINDESQKMVDVVEHVNQVTEEYNEVKSEYFDMAGLS